VQQLTGPPPVPDEPFPAPLKSSDRDTSKMSRSNGLHRPNEKRDTSEDWVHDKFRVESPKHKEDAPSNGNRRGDYYDGHAMRRPTDSYKPSVASNDHCKDDIGRVATHTPISRDRQGYLDNNPFKVDKPTVYRTLLETLVKKAYAVGVSSDDFFDMYYRSSRKAREDKSDGSAYWLLWKQECLIWKKLCR